MKIYKAMSHKIKIFFSSNEEILYIIFLSFIFAMTIQQFDLYKGNAAHLIHSIKEFDDNKLQNDWIANQDHHLPLFTYFNNLIIKIFSKNVIYVIHFILLSITSLYLFLISKTLFPKLYTKNFNLLLFTIFIYFMNG